MNKKETDPDKYIENLKKNAKPLDAEKFTYALKLAWLGDRKLFETYCPTFYVVECDNGDLEILVNEIPFAIISKGLSEVNDIHNIVVEHELAQLIVPQIRWTIGKWMVTEAMKARQKSKENK